MEKIGVFPLEFARKAKKHLERQMRDGGAETPRQPRTSSGRQAKCMSYWHIWLQRDVGTLAGELPLDIHTLNEDDQRSVTTISIPWNADDEIVKDLLRHIPDLGDGNDDGDATNDKFTVEGHWPFVAFKISNKSATGPRIRVIRGNEGGHSIVAAYPHIIPVVFNGDEGAGVEP